MSEAKEGKLLGRKKLLDPLLGTTEGTKITGTIIFYTSHALTVYSTGELAPLEAHARGDHHRCDNVVVPQQPLCRLARHLLTDGKETLGSSSYLSGVTVATYVPDLLCL